MSLFIQKMKAYLHVDCNSVQLLFGVF